MHDSRDRSGVNLLALETEATASGPALSQLWHNRLLDAASSGLSFLSSGLSATGSGIHGWARSPGSVFATGSGVDAGLQDSPSSSWTQLGSIGVWLGRTIAMDNVPVPAQGSSLADSDVDIPHGRSTASNPSMPLEQGYAIHASRAGAGAGAALSLPCTPTAYRGVEGQHSGAWGFNTHANTTNEACRPNSVRHIFTCPVAQETTTAVRVPGEDHSRPENEVSPGTRLLHGRHGAEGQGTYLHSQVSSNATPGRLSGGELHTSPQVQGRTAAPQRLSQTPCEGPPPTEPNVPVETSYPPGYRDPMDAFVSAMQRNSRRLDDLERGLTGSQDEGFSIDVRSSQINLVVTLVGLVVMLLAGGTKLYETIHSPSAH